MVQAVECSLSDAVALAAVDVLLAIPGTGGRTRSSARLLPRHNSNRFQRDQSEAMKIEYTLRFEDWAMFTMYVNRTVPSLARARKISHYGLPMVYGAFGIFAGLSLGDWIAGGSMLGLAFAWIFLYPMLAEYRTVKHLRKLERNGAAATILTDYSLEITEEGIEAGISSAQSHLPWSAIIGIVEDEGRAYLQLSLTSALVVPMSGPEVTEFIAECRKHVS